MYLSRHQTTDGPRWALDDALLPTGFNLGMALEMPRSGMSQQMYQTAPCFLNTV